MNRVAEVQEKICYFLVHITRFVFLLYACFALTFVQSACFFLLYACFALTFVQSALPYHWSRHGRCVIPLLFIRKGTIHELCHIIANELFAQAIPRENSHHDIDSFLCCCKFHHENFWSLRMCINHDT